MNWFIISVGVALVMALTAAVVGPHFVDWTEYRTEIAAGAEKALGAEVTIAGEADLRILPRPRLEVASVLIGPANRPIMTASHIEMNLELTPLVTGEIQIVDLTIDQPTIYARVLPDGRVELPDLGEPRTLASFFDVSDLKIDTVRLNDATVVVVDERTGVERQLSDISLTGSARSLRGPFNLTGRLQAAGAMQNVSISAGALAEGTMPLSVRLAPEESPIAVTFDGALSPQTAAPGLAGAFQVTSSAATPWSISGDMALDPTALRLGNATLTYGAGETPLQLAGRATYALTRSDPLELAFEARQIDLDRVDRALHEAGGPSVPADMLDRIVTYLTPLVNGLGTLSLPSVPVTADIDIGTVLAGGAVSRDVSVRLATGETGVRVERAEALLPGDTQVETNGRITPTGYAGAVRISASQPSIFVHWWSGEAFAGAVIDPILLEADIDVSADAMDARRLSLRIGDSRANGSWRSRTRDGSRTMTISLGAPLVDVDDVLDAWAILPRRMLPGEGTDVRIDLAVDRALIGSVEGSRLNINASYANDTLNIDALEAENLGGVSMFAVGQLGDLTGEPIGSITGTMKIADGDAMAASVRQLFPLSAVARRFGSMAPHLAPADFTFRVVGDKAPDAPALAVALEGEANGTRLIFDASGHPFAAPWSAHPTRLSLRISNPDARLLAQQLGLVPPATEGPGEVTLRMEGTPAEGARTDVRAEGFGALLTYAGAVTVGDASTFDGRLTVQADTLAPIASLADLALPVVSGVDLAADVSAGEAIVVDDLSGTLGGVALEGALTVASGAADGRLHVDTADVQRLTSLVLGPDAWTASTTGTLWPNSPFVRAAGLPVPLTLAVEADALTIGNQTIRDATFDLALADGGLTIGDARGRFEDGGIGGSLSVARTGAQARISGRLDLSGVAVGPLGWSAGSEPAVRGTLSLGTSFVSQGYTIADLVSRLDGDGTLTISDGLMADFNTAPFDWDDASGEAPDEATVRADFLAHLSAADTRFDTLTADLSLGNGTARLSELAFDPAVAMTVSNAFADLSAWRLRGDVSLRTIVSGTPAVPIWVTFTGPLEAPEREVDVSRLTAWAALRTIERQVEAVESDNEALAAEADAQGAPTSQTLESLGTSPTSGNAQDGAAGAEQTPADDGDATSTAGPRSDLPAPTSTDVTAASDEEPPSVSGEPGLGAPVAADSVDAFPQAPDDGRPAAPDTGARTEPRGADALPGLDDGEPIRRSSPPIPLSAPDPSAGSGDRAAAGQGEDGSVSADSTRGDPVGDLIRSVEPPAGATTQYERMRSRRESVAEELRRTAGGTAPAPFDMREPATAE